MFVHVFGFGLGAHQSHVVERGEQNATVHGVEMHEALQFEVHGVVGLASSLRLGTEHVFCTAAEARHMPGQTGVGYHLGNAGCPAFRHRNHAVEGFFGQDLRQCGSHGRERERIAGECASNAAHIAIFQFLPGDNAVSEFLREAVGGAGNAGSDRLAENNYIRLQVLGAGVASRPGADGMRLVDDQQGFVFSREFAKSFVVSRLGMHDAHVRHCGLGQHAGNISSGERLLKSRDVVELDYCRGYRRVHRGSDIAGAGTGRPVRSEMDEGFIHGPVIAPVVNKNLGTAGDLAAETNRKPIGIRRRERELPVRKIETFLQFLGDEDCIFSRKHQGDAMSHLLFGRFHCGGRRMAGHRAGIAEAEVGVAVTIDIEEVGSLRLADKGRESSRPLHHPVHGHARQERLAGSFE